VFVNGLELNLGTTVTQGVDFLGSYALPTDHSGTWTVGLTGTYTFKYDVAFTPGGTSFDELNNIGFPLRLRMRGSVGWSAGPVSALAFVNYENGYTNTEITPNESISSYTTVDLNVVYDLGKTFPALWSKDLSLTVHVDNLFDKDPPYVNIPISPNGGGGFDPNVASAIGRLVSLQIAKKF
jgi:iron complex outermembrane recepter protein